MVSDSLIRQQALDPQRSFIVQAPAGSGKTGLLVYRVLSLLANVDSPEQILAITFTRKATSEMRERLMQLLHDAEQGVVGDNEYEQTGLDLARQVLVQSQKRQWELLKAPQQLNIMTIDALCAKLAGEMPWLSQLGDRPRTTDRAETHYAAAVDQLLSQLLQPNSSVYAPLKEVMLELDFNYAQARSLFTRMLAKRDQWLRHIVQNDFASLRHALEQAWQDLCSEKFLILSKLMSSLGLDELVPIAHRAAELAEKESPLDVFKTCSLQDLDLPLNQLSLSLEHWKAIQYLLTVKNGDAFRKEVNKNIGFPTSEKAAKKRIKELLAVAREHPELLELLKEVSQLPTATFTEEDWNQVLSLEAVLKALAGFLQLRFRATSECDHSEVAQRANLALMELNAPTDLALRIDQQIDHILVDEFQDTSRGQLELLQKLTAGWHSSADDEQTIFLVGDPMQSIYRFREADVSLFLQVTDNSETQVFENLNIEPLTLSENFRSSNGLVDWFNTTFAASFPTDDDVTQGAISYAKATSTNPTDSLVSYVACSDFEQEAQRLADIIAQQLDEGSDANAKIAVLVRSRSHLKYILAELSRRQIAYSGVDIQPLNETPAAIDVLTLCKALMRKTDRVSWIALLRGPWCGLTLSEIYRLAPNTELDVWQQLSESIKTSSLGVESALRLKRFMGVMAEALAQRQEVALHSLCKWAWQQLGGQQTLFGASEEDIRQVLKVIAELEQGGELASLSELDNALENLYARPQAQAEARVVVSTIHKAKGLQYDTVVLPNLGGRGRADDKQILMWAERNVDYGQSDLLLAPIRLENEKGAHYDYLRYLEKQRSHHELVRLMYVACTRAERKIILSSVFKINDSNGEAELATPQSASLLNTIWSTVETPFNQAAVSLIEQFAPDTEHDEVDAAVEELDQTLHRIAHDYQPSRRRSFEWQAQNAINLSDDEADPEKSLEFEWATELANAVGLVLHKWLEFNAGSVLTQTVDAPIIRYWSVELAKHGLPHERISTAIKRLKDAVTTMQADPHAKFIFANHLEAKNELGLSTYEGTKVSRVWMDRTFIDEDGTRWIVDYKTTVSDVADKHEFVDQQMDRHRHQLQKYGRIMRSIETRPIRLAVYFPLLGIMRSWNYSPETNHQP